MNRRTASRIVLSFLAEELEYSIFQFVGEIGVIFILESRLNASMKSS